MRNINDLVEEIVKYSGPPDYLLTTPELLLHCSEVCNGPRIFRFDKGERPDISDDKYSFAYLQYLCSNCRRSKKIFSVAAKRDFGSASGLCYKFGELPEYGPLTSARLITLMGPDRELFLKGRRCE